VSPKEGEFVARDRHRDVGAKSAADGLRLPLALECAIDEAANVEQSPPPRFEVGIHPAVQSIRKLGQVDAVFTGPGQRLPHLVGRDREDRRKQSSQAVCDQVLHGLSGSPLR